uniref:G_PROTEIN_RECEP_F1_2 domain-containing protein n=1 Tax=Parastrongyloides trichosuri TaxID=131310 RepID=A0A0N4Z3X6_PARTI
MVNGEIYEYMYFVMIGVGIISSLVAILIISVSFRIFQGIYSYIFTISYLDFILALNLVYAGFYGLLVTEYGNGSNSVTPIECLYTAFFLLIWIIHDIATFFITFFLSFDRIMHSITSNNHEKFENYIMNGYGAFTAIIISSLCIIPLIEYPINLSANSSIAISSVCYEEELFGKKNYLFLWKFRFYTPMICLLMIIFAIIIYIFRGSVRILNFASTAFDKDTNWISFVITFRIFSEQLIIGLFTIILPTTENNYYLFRCAQTFFFLMSQNLMYYFLLEPYNLSFKRTFQKYMKNNIRTWQSADDPPSNFITRSRHSFSSMFGSWYSTGGNICGEAGIPDVNDFHRNISISFYCSDNVVVIDKYKESDREELPPVT